MYRTLRLKADTEPHVFTKNYTDYYILHYMHIKQDNIVQTSKKDCVDDEANKEKGEHNMISEDKNAMILWKSKNP